MSLQENDSRKPARSHSDPCVVQVSGVLPAEVRNHATALQNAGLLRKLVTSYVYKPNPLMDATARAADFLLRTRLSALLRRRPPIDRVPPGRIVRCPSREIWRVCRQTRSACEAEIVARTDAAFAAVDRAAARLVRDGDRVVIGREDVALASFRAARSRGICCLYQLPTAHYATVREVLQREMGEFPEPGFQPPLEPHFTPQRRRRKDLEVEGADHLLVPSLFVRDSLVRAGVAPERITVLPFGCEPAWAPSDQAVRDNTFLHAGRLSARKGTHRLLRVWKRLGAYRTHRLQLIGKMDLPQAYLKDFQGCYEYLGRFPRREMERQYQRAACFVLPALAEGFAMVILEALACGLPVLASRNSGAEGFLTPGREGLLHDAQDDDALADGLDWMLSHPKEREEMGRRAIDKARNWTWEHYHVEFLKLVRGLIERTAR